MRKHIKIIAGLTAMLLTLGAAGCTKSTSYPNFKNPTDISSEEVSEKYVINVRSEGGLGLNGVQVAAKNAAGQVVRRGISKNGKIELGLSLGEYTLEIDESTLPAGYSAGDTVYKTNPTKREPVTIKVPSKLIASDSAEETTFALGTVMRDFTFTDCLKNTYTISGLLQKKKAVVLNFFFSTCGPCQAEFPYLQRAYANRVAQKNDVEVLALSTTAMGDDDSKVLTFKTNNNLTFPMGIDTARITSSFGISNFPTTIVIDRYGLIAYRSKGTEPDESFWAQLFEDFASDNYVQKLTTSAGGEENPGDDPDDGTSGERVKPTYSMPSSSELGRVAGLDCAYRAEKDDEYSWPWLTSEEEGGYIYASNVGIGNSYAILYADIEMKEGELLAFEYNVSTELGSDKLYVLIDGKPMNDGWSGESGWKTCNLYVSERDRGADDPVELAFVFQKDAKDPSGSTFTDLAKIKNLRLTDSSEITEPTDMLRECATGEPQGFKYSHYIDAVLGDDGFYHKDAKNGPLVYATIDQIITPWNSLHGSTVTINGVLTSNAVYPVSATKYYKQGENGSYSVKIGSTDIAEAYTAYVNIHGYMEAPYHLIPVTPLLKGWLDAFVADNGGDDLENGWLEFCYYYEHFGSEHTDGVNCKVYVDTTQGVTKYNPFTAYLTSDATVDNFQPAIPEGCKTYNQTTGRNIAYINFPMQLGHNGSYYEFIAPKKGVYQLRAYTTNCSPTSMDPDENGYTAPAQTAISVYGENNEYLLYGNEPRDFDSITDVETVVIDGKPTDIPKYDAFNEYVTLEAGQKVYLYLENAPQYTTYYDFDIKYLGTSFETWFVASTLGGAWTTGTDNGQTTYIYLGINVKYDADDDCYYYVENGVMTDRKVYIDMTHGSFFRSELPGYNFQTLEKMVNDGIFLDPKTNVTGDWSAYNAQRDMNQFLGESIEGKTEDDELYGLIEANGRIVEIINNLITAYGDLGDGRGWLAFAVYKANFGE